ncbi:MAG: tetratricopeptide repeat protein [candidate division NC10 bacterium]
MMNRLWTATLISAFFALAAAPAPAQPEDEDNPVEASTLQAQEAPAKPAPQAEQAPPAAAKPQEQSPAAPAKPAEQAPKPAAEPSRLPELPKAAAPENAPEAASAPKSAPVPPPPPPPPSAAQREKAELTFLQNTFQAAAQDLLPALAEQVDAYLWEFRESPDADQAQYLKAQIDDKQGDSVTTAVDLLKLLYEYPQTEYKMNAKKRLFEIVDKKFGKRLKPAVAEIAKGPVEGLDRPQRYAALLRSLVNLKENAFYQPLIVEFREFLRRYPNNLGAGEMSYLLGQLHFQSGNYRMSVLINEKILSANKEGPLAAKAQTAIADTYATAMKDYNKAVEAYQMVTKKFGAYPEAGDAYVKMARIFDENLKQPDLALETLDKIVAGYPGSDAAYKAYTETARIQREKNQDFGKAVAALQGAAKMFKGEERAAAALKQAASIASDDLKDDTLQAQSLKDIASNCPQCKTAPDALWEAGQVYEKKIKSSAEALKAYQELVGAYPTYSRVKDVNKRIKALSK